MLGLREGSGKVAIYDFIPKMSIGTPQDGTSDVATCPHLGHGEGRGKVATSHFVPAMSVGTPQEGGGKVANYDLVPTTS